MINQGHNLFDGIFRLTTVSDTNLLNTQIAKLPCDNSKCFLDVISAVECFLEIQTLNF